MKYPTPLTCPPEYCVHPSYAHNGTFPGCSVASGPTITHTFHKEDAYVQLDVLELLKHSTSLLLRISATSQYSDASLAYKLLDAEKNENPGAKAD